MENFLNAAAIWFIVGLAFFVLEFILPGFILFFLAIGAWVVGIVTLFTDLSVDLQLIIFITASVLSIVFFRKALKNFYTSKNFSTPNLEHDYIGKIAKVQSDILPGKNGKVEFKGTIWDAKSSDAIAKGETALIIGTDSIVLIVSTTK